MSQKKLNVGIWPAPNSTEPTQRHSVCLKSRANDVILTDLHLALNETREANLVLLFLNTVTLVVDN